MYKKFRCTALHIEKALGIFRDLITTTRTGPKIHGVSSISSHESRLDTSNEVQTHYNYEYPSMDENRVSPVATERLMNHECGRQ